jgi:hypothetical protein
MVFHTVHIDNLLPEVGFLYSFSFQNWFSSVSITATSDSSYTTCGAYQ